MVIRMRELAVQMNNGVYTEADRLNAQLEVSALLAEIDKIADNTAFNDVKVLDGSYSADIRAGNTNKEIINVTIDRMKTDTLGGNYITTGVAAAKAETDITKAQVARHATSSSTVVKVTEDDYASLDNAIFSKEFNTATSGGFAKSFTGGTTAWSLSGTDKDSFVIESDGDVKTAAGVKLDADAKAKYEFTVELTHTSTSGVVTKYTDDVVLNVEKRVDAAATADITVVEADATVLKAKETSNLTLDVTKLLSRDFIAFTKANTGGNYSLVAHSVATTDKDLFEFATATSPALTLQSGKVLNFEDSATRKFTVAYTDTAGNVFKEAVTLNVENVTSDDPVNPTAATLGGGAGKTTIALDVGATGSATVLDLTTAANQTKLSTGAQAFIAATLADNSKTLTFATAYTGTTETGATMAAGGASGTAGTITVAAGTTAGATSTVAEVTISDGTNSFKETITLAVTAVAAGAGAVNAASNQANAKSTVTLTGSSNNADDTIEIDLTSSALFADLAAFKSANAGLTYTVTSAANPNVTHTTGSAAGSQKITLKGNADTTITLTYGTFEQTIKINPSDLTSVTAAATASFVSSKAADNTSQGSAVSTAVNKGTSNLTFNEAREGEIKVADLNSHLSDFVKLNPKGIYSLSGTDKADFTIDGKTGTITSASLIDFETKTSYAINLVYTLGDKSFTEAINIRVLDDATDAGEHLKDVALTTSDGAREAVTILDKALSQISSSQAKLGAIQNRLQHNIDNLSMASMLTETARGRVTDADFARETSELSKQQILGQAATSMLAQANQSKQSVLALLQ